MRNTAPGAPVVSRVILRYVLTKTFFGTFGIISGFVTLGITCRLRYFVILFFDPGPKRYHVIRANLFEYQSGKITAT